MIARALIAAVALAAAPAGARAVDPDGAATAAAASPGPEPAPATTTAKAAEPEKEEGEGWLDIGHAFIEHRIFAPVLRVDRFFSDERDLEAERARSFLQLRQELRFTEGRDTPGYTTTVNANLKLPGLNKELRKLQVEVTGQTRDVFSALFPGQSATPGEVPTSESGFNKAEAGLGHRLFETLATSVATHGDLGAGVIMTWPPGVYTRARIRFVESLGRGFLSRQALTGFWRTDTLFGTTASAEIERPLSPRTLARLSGSSTLTQRSRGVEWGGDLALITTLKLRIGAQLGFSMSGATESPVGVDLYRTYLRLRRDVYRKWIFVELTPEYDWAFTRERGYHDFWAVTVRFEVQFQGNEAPRAPAPGEREPPEPREPPPAGP